MPVITLVKVPNDYGVESHLGYGDMIFSFFSSVSYHLEGPGNWGTRFPRLLLDLCDHGVIDNAHLDEFEAELHTIFRELRNFSIHDAIYDIGDLTKKIPWELLPGAESFNLAEAWVTPRGAVSYYTELLETIEWARRRNAGILLIYPPETAFRDTLFQRKEKGREYWIKEKSK